MNSDYYWDKIKELNAQFEAGLDLSLSTWEEELLRLENPLT